MNAIRILIVDDHPVFSAGMQHVVSSMSDVDCVCANDGATALALLSEDDNFDLIMVDLSMPGIDGISFLQSLEARGLPIPAVVVSAVEDVRQIHAALEHGAFGFIPKSMSSGEMQAAIGEVLDGETFIPPHLKLPLARLSRKARKTDAEGGLTRRQLEVLHLVNKGQTNKQIARTLFVSENTVKFHLSTLMEALDARTRTECLAKAQRLGLLDV